MIFSDQKRIKQVLYNLIGNALKFTYDGKIKLSVLFDSHSSSMVTHVKDTGIGISEEDLAKLFKFFG